MFIFLSLFILALVFNSWIYTQQLHAIFEDIEHLSSLI